MKKLLSLLLLSPLVVGEEEKLSNESSYKYLPLSDKSSYIYLDCGDETPTMYRQHLLLRVMPEVSVETLDDNLKWSRDSMQVIDLDEYFTEGKAGYYKITRDTLKLRIIEKWGTGYQTFECFITSKEKIVEEINLIKNKKKSKQKI